ncbi:MAG: FG-GAP-like repeat-containing protein [Steroidobacteraceae bacterium]
MLTDQLARGATDWSTQDYDLYPGDFNGDGKTDILYVAKDASKVSGIALSDGAGPNIPFQSWPSNYLGIPWYGNHYNVIIGDFNDDGHADIFLQSTTPGDHYLLLADQRGNINGISETVPNTTQGVSWSADKHRILAGDFNGDGFTDLFLQATSSTELNAVVLTDSTGTYQGIVNLAATAPWKTWTDTFLGYRWSTAEAKLYIGDFNGDGLSDLLIQARPKFVVIDYDVSFPVPTYPPNMNGVLTTAPGAVFTVRGAQAWSRNAFGVDWSPLSSTPVVGQFNTATGCPACSGVLVQGASAAKGSFMLTGNSTGAIFSTGTALASNVAWSSDSNRLMAANFAGTGVNTSVYLQAHDPSGTNSIAGNVNGTSVSTTTHSPAAPTGVVPATAVGATPGSFAVSDMGTATYSLPITVPPGVAGMQPSLSISYQSGMGNGLLGVGWNLTGLSQIERCKKTLAEDGSNDSPALATTDLFCLDGNKLRNTSGAAYGADGSTYQAEFEQFSRITAHGTAGNGPAYFTVEAKNGLRFEYGNTADSRIEAVNSAQAATARVWAVNKISDRYGNTLAVIYQEDGAPNGSFRPDHIDYTSNSNAGLAAAYRVSFVYENRPSTDSVTEYAAGGLVHETQRLNRIETRYNDPAVGAFRLVRRYQLSYNTSGENARSRLEAVQECDTSSNCLSPTMISWQDGLTGLGAELSAANLGSFASSAIPIDIDGDGRADLLFPSTTNWSFMLASASGGYGAVQPTSIAHNGKYAFAIPIDYNSDGMTDLLVPDANGKWQILQSTGSGFTPISTNITAPTVAGNAWVADVDGDGRQDLVYDTTSAGGQLFVYFNSATGFSGSATLAYTLNSTQYFSTSAFQPGQNVYRSSIQFADFNGDGRVDILVASEQPAPHESTRLVAQLLLSTGFGYVTGLVGNSYTERNLFGQAYVNWRVLDLNGDGLSDVAYPCVLSTTVWCVRFGTGTGLSTEVNTGAAVATSLVNSLVVDWNGDGKMDLLQAGSSGNWQVMISTGTTLSAPVEIGVSAAGAANAMVADVDGDGLEDFVYADSSNVWRYRLRQGLTADLVNAVTDGFGNGVRVSYGALTDSSLYTKGTLPAFPEFAVKSPLHVVSSFVSTDGVGGSFTTTESYKHLLANMQGRGIEGFANRSETDGRTGIRTDLVYNQGFPLSGTIYSVTSVQPNGHVISQLVNTYVDQPTSTTQFNDRHFPILSDQTEQSNEVSAANSSIDGQPVTLVSTHTAVDGYGNPTDITVNTIDQTGSGLTYTTHTVNTIALADTTNWCLDFMSQQTVTKTIPASEAPTGSPQAVTRTTQFVKDTANLDKCRGQQQIIEPTPAASSVTTTLGYDSFGHVNTQTVTASGVTTRQSSVSYGSQGVLATTVTDAEGAVSISGYDYALGVAIRSTDPNGIPTSWTYDGFGRKKTESRPDGTSSSWIYTACGVGTAYCGDALLRFQVYEQQLDSTGQVIQFGTQRVDALGRPKYTEVQTLSGVTSIVRTNYDNQGRIVQKTRPYFSGSPTYYTSYTYDLIGRPLSEQRQVSETDSTLQSTQISYSKLTQTLQDANGHTQTKVLNSLGQVVRVTDAANGVASYKYEPFGNLGSTQDPAGNHIGATYNVRGFRLTSDDSDLGHWSYTYYPTGEMQTQTDAKNQVTTYTYDRIGRNLTRIEAEGMTSWTWGTLSDNTASAKYVGHIKTITSPGGYSEIYTYDQYGRSKDTTTVIDSTSYVVSSAYDGTTGLLSSVTYPLSTTAVANSRLQLNYSYQHGMLASITDANAPGTVYWRNIVNNAAGQMVDEQYGNGLHTLSTYDAVNGLIGSRTTGSTGQIQNLSYLWDKVGNLKERADAGQSLTEDFTYDTLNRLKTSTLKVGTAAATTNLSVNYDSLGNITSKSDISAGSTWAYDATRKHAVVTAGSHTYGYDGNGNMSSRDGSVITWTSYNLPSQIAQGSNTTQFLYGAARQRTKEVAVTATGGSLPAGTETTIYVGGIFEKVTKPSGVIEYKHYVMGGSRPVALRTLRSNAVNDTRYLHTDHLGSVAVITDESAQTTVKLSFDAFGNRRGSSSWGGSPPPADWSSIAAVTHRGFTGHEQLDNVGLVHMNGRVYDPTIGRFLSADPYVQAPLQSQSLNRYSYIMNDPLSGTDPTGFFSFGSLFNPFSKDNPLNPFGHVGLSILRTGFKFDLFAQSVIFGARLGDKTLVKYPWLQPLARAAACYWGGPWGCAAASAHLARIDGASGVDIIVAGVGGYLSGGVGGAGGFAAAVAREYVNYEVYTVVDRIAVRNGINVNWVNRGLLALQVLGRISGKTTMGGELNRGGVAADVLSLPAKLWALPSTVVGLIYGGVGDVLGLMMGMDSRVLFAYNSVQFTNNPLMLSAVTFGNVIIYAGGSDYSPESIGKGENFTLGYQEMQHTSQAEILGPLYLPAHIIFGIGSEIMSGDWHFSNALEQGPHSQNPDPWRQH